MKIENGYLVDKRIKYKCYSIIRYDTNEFIKEVKIDGSKPSLGRKERKKILENLGYDPDKYCFVDMKKYIHQITIWKMDEIQHFSKQYEIEAGKTLNIADLTALRGESEVLL